MKKRMIEAIKAKAKMLEMWELDLKEGDDFEAFENVSRLCAELSQFIYILSGKRFNGLDDIKAIKAYVEEL